MGTNYYLHRNVCRECGRSDEPLHIGKSSAGWCFALHVIPDRGIHDLPDWEREWQHGVIRNEYGDAVMPKEMRRVITERKWMLPENGRRWWLGYNSEADFHAQNQSEPGPDNLLRHRIMPSWCSGHGVGTWDLMPGEFS